jgi:hypothetical protein
MGRRLRQRAEESIDGPPLLTPIGDDSRVAMVHAQLAPISSRRALLDSYRRESFFRSLTDLVCHGPEVQVLEMAYSLRWAELTPDDTVDDMEGCFET